MVAMIATSELEYPPGNVLKPGDPFEAEDGHDKLLATLGRAKPSVAAKAADAPSTESSSTETDAGQTKAAAKPPKPPAKPRPQTQAT